MSLGIGWWRVSMLEGLDYGFSTNVLSVFRVPIATGTCFRNVRGCVPCTRPRKFRFVIRVPWPEKQRRVTVDLHTYGLPARYRNVHGPFHSVCGPSGAFFSSSTRENRNYYHVPREAVIATSLHTAASWRQRYNVTSAVPDERRTRLRPPSPVRAHKKIVTKCCSRTWRFRWVLKRSTIVSLTIDQRYSYERVHKTRSGRDGKNTITGRLRPGPLLPLIPYPKKV